MVRHEVVPEQHARVPLDRLDVEENAYIAVSPWVWSQALCVTLMYDARCLQRVVRIVCWLNAKRRVRDQPSSLL